MYSEEEKKKDFEFFKSINSRFYQDNGHCFVAIKNQSIIDHNASPTELIASMVNKGHEVGSYILQECRGLESDFTNTVMRLMINA